MYDHYWFVLLKNCNMWCLSFIQIIQFLVEINLGSTKMYGALNQDSRTKKKKLVTMSGTIRPWCLINDTRWVWHFPDIESCNLRPSRINLQRTSRLWVSEGEGKIRSSSGGSAKPGGTRTCAISSYARRVWCRVRITGKARITFPCLGNTTLLLFSSWIKLCHQLYVALDHHSWFNGVKNVHNYM